MPFSLPALVGPLEQRVAGREAVAHAAALGTRPVAPAQALVQGGPQLCDLLLRRLLRRRRLAVMRFLAQEHAELCVYTMTYMR